MDVINLPMGMRRSLLCDSHRSEQKQLTRIEIEAHVNEFLRKGGKPQEIPAAWDHLDPSSLKSTSKIAADLEERKAALRKKEEPMFVSGTDAVRILKVGRLRFNQLVASGELTPHHHVSKKKHPRFAVADLKKILSTLEKQNA